MRKLINAIIEDLRLLKFLVLHDRSYRNSSWLIIGTTAMIIIGLLQFDFSNLITERILKPQTKTILLQMAPKIIGIIGLIALYLLNHHYFKKWRTVHSLSRENLEKINRYYGR